MRRGLRINLPIQEKSEDRAKLSLRFVPAIWQAVAQAMAQGGYNLKQRSQWVTEALDSLLNFLEKDCANSDDVASYLKNFHPAVANIPPVKITLSVVSSQRLLALVEPLKESHQFDDVKTRILFAAIIKRLAKEEGVDLRTVAHNLTASTVETGPRKPF